MGAVAVFLVHKSMDYEISPEEMKEQAVWERVTAAGCAV